MSLKVRKTRKRRTRSSFILFFFPPKLGGLCFRGRKLVSGNERDPTCEKKFDAEAASSQGERVKKEERRAWWWFARVRARKRGFGAVPVSGYNRLSALLPSGNFSATSRASRRLHCTTYAAEHYITENDEPRVQSPGTLASSTCVMRRAQQRVVALYTRNSRNRSTLHHHCRGIGDVLLLRFLVMRNEQIKWLPLW